jgi:hypothetical protein
MFVIPMEDVKIDSGGCRKEKEITSKSEEGIIVTYKSGATLFHQDPRCRSHHSRCKKQKRKYIQVQIYLDIKKFRDVQTHIRCNKI